MKQKLTNLPVSNFWNFVIIGENKTSNVKSTTFVPALLDAIQDTGPFIVFEADRIISLLPLTFDDDTSIPFYSRNIFKICIHLLTLKINSPLATQLCLTALLQDIPDRMTQIQLNCEIFRSSILYWVAE